MADKSFLADRQRVAIFCTVVVAVSLIFISHLRTEPTADAAVFLYMGQGLLQGEVPYIDQIDAKPPMIFYLSALIESLPGPARIWIAVLEAASILATCVLLYKNIKARTAGLFFVLAFMGMTNTAMTLTHMTETYTMPLQAIAFICMTRVLGQPRSSWKDLLIFGVTGGIAFFLRQNLIGMWIAGAVVLIIERVRARKYSRIAPEIGLIVLGVFIVLVPVLVHLAAEYALDDFFRESFATYFKYSASASLSLRVWNILVVASKFPWLFAAGSVLAVLALGWARGRRPELAQRVLLLAFPVELLLAGLSGNTFDHYYIPVIVPTSYLIAVSINGLAQSIPDRVQRKLAVATLAVGLFAIALPGINVRLSELYHSALTPAQRQLKAVATNLVGQETRSFVWGYAPEFYLWSSTRSPIPYFHQLPLNIDGFDRRRIIGTITDSLSADPPRFIVDGNAAGFGLPPLMKTSRLKWLTEHQGDDTARLRHDIDLAAAPVLRIIDEQYEPIMTGLDFAIFKRIEIATRVD